MKLVLIAFVALSCRYATAQPCPLVQDEFATSYSMSILANDLPLKWIMRNLSCVGDNYVVTWGKIFSNNGRIVLGLSDGSDTWIDLIILEDIESHIVRGTFMEDIVPNLGHTFVIKIKIKTNLDLGHLPSMYYSDDYTIDPNSAQSNF